MSFSVSYTYKIIDKFTPQLRAIEQATESFNKKIGMINASTKDASAGLKNLSREAERASRGVEKATGNMGRQLDKLKGKGGAGGGGIFDGIASGLGRASDKLQGFASSAGAIAGTIGGGLLLKKFSSDAMGLEDSVINLRKGFDFANQNELDEFQKKLAAVGKTIGESRTAMNNLGYTAGKLGIEMDQVPEFALLSGKASVAFDFDIAEATETLALLRTQFGLTTNEQLKNVLDTVNYVDDKSNASAKGILSVMSRLSGTFKTLNVPAEKAVAFSGIAQQLAPNMRPELAAEGLKMFIQKMQDQTVFKPEVAQGLATNFEGTIRDILGQFAGMEDSARNIKIQEIFGLNATPFVLGLISNMDVLNKTLAVAADKTNAVGSMNREFEKRTEAASFKLKVMSASLTDTAAIIGQQVLPFIKELALWLGEVIPKIQAWSAENPGLVKFGMSALAILVVMAPLALALSAVVSGIGAMATVIGFLTPLVVTALPVISGLMVSFSPLAAVAISMFAVYQSAMLLLEVLKSIGEVGVLQTLKDIGGTVLDAIGFEEAAINMASNKTTNVNSRVDGNIGIDVTGPGKVSRANFVTPLGNLGTNVAGGM